MGVVKCQFFNKLNNKHLRFRFRLDFNWHLITFCIVHDFVFLYFSNDCIVVFSPDVFFVVKNVAVIVATSWILKIINLQANPEWIKIDYILYEVLLKTLNINFISWLNWFIFVRNSSILVLIVSKYCYKYIFVNSYTYSNL